MENKAWEIFDTKIGKLLIEATKKGVCTIHFLDNESSPEYHSSKKKKALTHLNQLKTELQEYFQGNRKKFNVSIDMKGTEFQIKVWKALLEIPFGATKTYKEQSIIVGDLKAIRAVGTANGKNPIPIVIPCHRVVGSDGSLTGFSGGLWRKRFLLDLESNQLSLF